MISGKLDRFRITGICMADNTHSRVTQEDALQAFGGFRGAIGNNHLPGMLAVANTNAAAMVEANPSSAIGSVEQSVQNRPVADRVGAIQHGFRFPVGGSHRTSVQVIATDHDRGF